MTKRNASNLKLYRETCKKVIKRSDNICEVMINGKRCGKYINDPVWDNFAHTQSRNGMSDEEVLSPENIIFTCLEHHHKEHETGEKLERCEYDEITYIPDEQ